jgi:aryl-alcohol dehydrogenase-like predicted oxidoreductase
VPARNIEAAAAYREAFDPGQDRTGTRAAALAHHRADPGTSSVEQLRENVAAANLVLPADAVAELDTIHLEAAG